MPRKLTAVMCGGVLLAGGGCARALTPGGTDVTAPPVAESARLAAQPADRIVPVADHHAHIMTQTAIARVFRPPLPAVQLPDDLAALLRERARVWNDPAALARLYTENSLALTSRNPSWIRGRDEVAGFVGTLFGRPHQVTPIAYGVDGSTGFIAGYFTRESETGTRTFGHVHLALSRGADGVWRIAAETAFFPGPRTPEEVPAEQLIAELDAAGIQRAAVLSTAYWFGSAGAVPAETDHAQVRAENDWVGEQVARFPTRLVGFCSFNPLKDYALEELRRCAGNPHLKGLKLHFGDAGVDLRDARQLETVRQVFRAANEHRLPIVVHLMTPDTSYGRAHSEIFLSQLVTAAPDIPIQIAHMAGSGPDYNSDAAFAVFAEAAAAGDPRMKNVYTDVATVVTLSQSAETLALIARRIREFGLERVLYASDSPASPEFTRDLGWLYFTRLPLTLTEFRAIADNVAPYLR